mmetsp:Transcript_13506/g.33153  ORF Transcript_13506/g.33153 Transcript_13506/m.33153 type:complete len:221 (+) Transcript_13506:4889-5551(+)
MVAGEFGESPLRRRKSGSSWRDRTNSYTVWSQLLLSSSSKLSLSSSPEHGATLFISSDRIELRRPTRFCCEDEPFAPAIAAFALPPPLAEIRPPKTPGAFICPAIVLAGGFCAGSTTADPLCAAPAGVPGGPPVAVPLRQCHAQLPPFCAACGPSPRKLVVGSNSAFTLEEVLTTGGGGVPLFAATAVVGEAAPDPAPAGATAAARGPFVLARSKLTERR